MRLDGMARVCLAGFLCLVQAWVAPALAQAPAPLSQASESAVKAAFLYKFGSFVEWPAGTFARPDEPLVIGVAGDETVAADLDQLLAGRPADSRPIAMRRVRDAQGIAGLHIFFIGGSRESRVRELLPPATAPVLVVTDQDGGLLLGSSINFRTTDGRVRFSAAPAAAEARGVKLSSRLLAVAQSVEGRSR